MSSDFAGGNSGSSGVLGGLSLGRIVVLLPTFFLVRFITNFIYRLYFHPLKNFPGPKFAAASRIPWNWAILKGRRDVVLRDMHAKYGHLVRINPDELSCTDPNAWKDIHGHGTKGTPGSVPQKDWTRYGRAVNGAYNLLVARPEDHSRMRKIFNPAFSDRALKQQEPLFVKYADLLVTKLKEGTEADPDKKWDMVRMYNFTTFDVMGDLTFGEPLHMLSNAEYDPWVSIIFASVRAVSHIGILTAYPWLWKTFKAIVPESFNKKRVDHFQYAVKRVTKRLEKGRDSEGVDLWDLVLDQKEGRGLTRDEMDANASIFMIAGTETTATLLSGMTNLLLTNPNCMKKLTSEIRDAFTSVDDMTMESLAALPYLAACIKESFRIYPPVPLGLPRLTPENGSTVAGHFIPPYSSIAIPQHAMYTHADNFKQPYDFIPERWLGDSRFESDQRQCVQPFSVGTRDCVGKNMAYHEMRHIIGRVLYNFDLELCEESKDWADQLTYILWEKKPLMCKLRPVR